MDLAYNRGPGFSDELHGPPDPDIYALKKKGIDKAGFGLPMVDIMRGLRAEGFDPAVKQGIRTPRDATLNYIRGTSDVLDTSGSLHLTGQGIDLRDRQLLDDIASPEGRRYAETYHRLRSEHPELSAASPGNPWYDAHHTEYITPGAGSFKQRRQSDKVTAGKMVAKYLQEQGVTREEIGSLREKLRSEMEEKKLKGEARKSYRDTRGPQLFRELIQQKKEASKPKPVSSVTPEEQEALTVARNFVRSSINVPVKGRSEQTTIGGDKEYKPV